MSVFDLALATLHADPNMDTDAEWRAAAGGVWRAVAVAAVLRMADLAPDTPRRGNLLRRLSPPETGRIEEVTPDSLDISFRLWLVRTA